jgi:hypothetical protein
MTWGAGGLFVNPWIGTFNGTALQQFKWTADSIKCALYNNTPTPNYSDSLANSVYLVGQWVTGNEVTGTNWAAGGQVLGSTTLTESPTRTLMFDAADVSVATTTLSSVYGCLIFDNTLATKYALLAVPFSGSPFATVAGTFGITWAATGVFTFSLAG